MSYESMLNPLHMVFQRFCPENGSKIFSFCTEIGCDCAFCSEIERNLRTGNHMSVLTEMRPVLFTGLWSSNANKDTILNTILLFRYEANGQV